MSEDCFIVVEIDFVCLVFEYLTFSSLDELFTNMLLKTIYANESMLSNGDRGLQKTNCNDDG